MEKQRHRKIKLNAHLIFGAAVLGFVILFAVIALAATPLFADDAAKIRELIDQQWKDVAKKIHARINPDMKGIHLGRRDYIYTYLYVIYILVKSLLVIEIYNICLKTYGYKNYL